jgi:predicted 3-demethylubiquinone-9 3-methyltransferase (glyoxalase superfamily)
MDKIYPCLWFDDRIEDAVNLYVGVFKGKVLDTSRYGDVGPLPEGKVLTMHFEIFGKTFMALNGGPQFQFNEAVSIYVDCEDQAEVDRYWNALTADGGAESMCGWLKDKYGLSWQIVPKALGTYLGGSDKAGANRAMKAMLQMRKIIVADLEKAYAG